jgi:hypothetical protein
MKVLNHHVYEYKKGLRNLVLHTMHSSLKEEALHKLDSNQISYFVQEVTLEKINVFFGADECIDIIKHFNKNKLSDFNPEQDFMLGIMLGYGRLQQCKRYLEREDNMVGAENREVCNSLI